MGIKFVFILIFVFAMWANAENCAVTSGPEGGERTRMIRMAEGREIIVVGHNHGDRALPFSLSELLRETPAPTNAVFQQRIQNLLGGIKQSINHAKEDLAYLKQILKDRPQLKWIGVESIERIALGNVEQYGFLRDEFKKELERRQLPFGEEENNLIMVAAGVPSFLYMTEPSYYMGRELHGFESEEAINVANEAEKNSQRTYEALKKLAGEDRDFMGNISGTEFQLWHSFERYVPEIDHAHYFESISNAPIPPRYRELTLAWVEAQLKEMDAYKDREPSVARNLTKVGQSLIIFMGTQHLPSMMKQLEKECHKLQK